MKNPKILIVDDDVDFTKALRAILEGEDYEVATAVDKAEGLEKIRTDKPDLLVLDVMMSTWQDGFEMARELKKNRLYEQMPIIMLTGVKGRTGIEFKSTAGDPVWCPVDSFLDKPVEADVLLAEIKKLLKEKT